MAEITLVRFKFKEGGRQVWLDWSGELLRRKAEVIATLKNEGVSSEACFISQNGEDVFYLMEAGDLKKAKEMSHNSSFPIDSEHRSKRNSCLEYVESLDPLFYFQNK